MDLIKNMTIYFVLDTSKLNIHIISLIKHEYFINNFIEYTVHNHIFMRDAITFEI